MEPCVVIYLFSATHDILFDQWSMFLLPTNNAVRNMTIVGTIDHGSCHNNVTGRFFGYYGWDDLR